MQSASPQQGHSGAVGSSQPQSMNPLPPELAMDLDPEARRAEELRMLLMGFVTGLSIAGVFLIYIVFESAKLLP